MDIPLYNQKGEQVGTTQLPAKIFDVPMSTDVVHQAFETQTANARHSIAHTKGRGDVRGGGKKPWRQKGTGRARHASIRSPIWKGGGVAFGPTKERNFSKKINKKLWRKALAMVLSSKVRDGEFLMLEALQFEQPKTKEAVAVFKNLAPHLPQYRSSKKKNDSILLVTPGKDRRIEQAVGNMAYADVISADSLNVRDLLAAKYVVLMKDAVSVIGSMYAINK